MRFYKILLEVNFTNQAHLSLKKFSICRANFGAKFHSVKTSLHYLDTTIMIIGFNLNYSTKT